MLHAHLNPQELSKNYRQSEPFPHLVIDDFLEAEFASGCSADFDNVHPEQWSLYSKEGYAKKLEFRKQHLMGKHLQRFFEMANSEPFVHQLEEITGIRGLQPDPSLMGGGLHLIQPGGFLGVHIDFNWFEEKQMHRRLNLVLYLNEAWKPSNGGELELWQAEPQVCIKKIAPIYNRLALFEVGPRNFHGYPDQIRHQPRRALALFYYTKQIPEKDFREPHKTIYLD